MAYHIGWIWFLAIILIILVIVLIVLAIVNGSSVWSSWWFWLLLALSVVIFIILIILLIYRKPSKPCRRKYVSRTKNGINSQHYSNQVSEPVYVTKVSHQPAIVTQGSGQQVARSPRQRPVQQPIQYVQMPVQTPVQQPIQYVQMPVQTSGTPVSYTAQPPSLTQYTTNTDAPLQPVQYVQTPPVQTTQVSPQQSNTMNLGSVRSTYEMMQTPLE